MKTATASINGANTRCTSCRVLPGKQHKADCTGGLHDLSATSRKDENAAWILKRRLAHHRALETLAQQVGCDTKGLTLWRQLRRVENWLSAYSVQHCNGYIDGDKWDDIKVQGYAKLAKVFGHRIPVGVYINSDPRGHAVKLDCDKVAIPSGMERDWGGNGILAAEID